jgi:hypothetical protein
MADATVEIVRRSAGLACVRAGDLVLRAKQLIDAGTAAFTLDGVVGEVYHVEYYPWRTSLWFYADGRTKFPGQKPLSPLLVGRAMRVVDPTSIVHCWEV